MYILSRVTPIDHLEFGPRCYHAIRSKKYSAFITKRYAKPFLSWYLLLTKNLLLEVPWSIAPTKGPKSLNSPVPAILESNLCEQLPLIGDLFESLKVRTSVKQYRILIWPLPFSERKLFVFQHEGKSARTIATIFRSRSVQAVFKVSQFKHNQGRTEM